MRRVFPWLLGACVVAPAAAQAPQAAVAASGAGIYSCVTPDGRKLTADRPIAACTTVEQRVLNNDGSLRRIHPPSLTVDERAVVEAEERRVANLRAARLDAIRRDRNLKNRYPDEATHQKAREAALDTVRLAMRASEARLVALASERRPLLDEAQFYEGKTLPGKLRQQIESNDTATEAQRAAIANQLAELERVTRLYDAELDRLHKLWAGAAPGSLGPVSEAQPLHNGARASP